MRRENRYKTLLNARLDANVDIFWIALLVSVVRKKRFVQ